MYKESECAVSDRIRALLAGVLGAGQLDNEADGCTRMRVAIRRYVIRSGRELVPLSKRSLRGLVIGEFVLKSYPDGGYPRTDRSQSLRTLATAIE